MKKYLYIALMLGSIFTLLSCSSGLPKAGFPETGTYKVELPMEIAGRKRNYLIHIPCGFDIRKKLPLILIIHGAFSNARKIEKETGFSELSDREGFLVAYPNGGYSLFGFLQHWNAGFCCGRAKEKNVDDIGFLMEVITDIHTRFNIDKSRVYMVGFSNGGMLTYLFASQHTEILAAAAPMAATIGGRRSTDSPIWIMPRPKQTLPIIAFHAKDDRSIPYNGGISPRGKGEGELLSVAESMKFWIENNKCRPEPNVEILHAGRVIKKTWEGSSERNRVILYTLKQWGHRWPGPYYTRNLPESDPFWGFDSAEIIWNFFKSYSR